MVTRSPEGLVAARLLELQAEARAPLVFVTSSERRAQRLARLLQAFGGVEDAPAVVLLPPWDCLPYDQASPSREAMGGRMVALARVLASAAEGRPCLVITTPDAVLQRLPPPERAEGFPLQTGAPLDGEALRAFAMQAGYEEDDRVDECGEIALRGEVVDIFPAGEAQPVRLDMGEGRVLAIRRYDALSQRSLADMPGLTLHPVTELPAELAAGSEAGAEHRLPHAWPRLATLFELLPKARLVEEEGARRRRAAFLDIVAEAHRERSRPAASATASAAAVPAPDALYLTAAEWEALSGERGLAWNGADDTGDETPDFATMRRPDRAFAAFLQAEAARGQRLLLVAATAEDLAFMARRARRALADGPGVTDAGDNPWAEVLAAAPGACLLLTAELDRGHIDQRHAVTVVAAADLLGSRAATGEDAAVQSAPWQAEVASLHLGDLVVHVDHGVGVLRAMESIETPAGPGEAVRLHYAKDGVLLVPAEEAGKLWRYGSEEGAVALDRLNTQGWAKRRAKIDAEITRTAEGLVALAAARQGLEAPKLVPPPQLYERFVARFPYGETVDQRRAIEDVLADMASGRPMNRLVVGDVGFGKTEIALRAAAAAALAGRQVAIAAPTTVLARQHFLTFQRRFADLGVEVAQLSRLAGSREARRTRAGLADGSVRIVVGTHALAGDSVSFTDLGLLVIDEEQRFGAAQKERLRQLGAGAHVLAMTATPIPRTLQGALVGLQELSTLLTPPARRRPIRTFLMEYAPAALRAALLRERRRGGQSFVVAPRIEDVEALEAELATLVPELAVRVAHGRMKPDAVDAAMVDFADGRDDVLLATSIIESGLDVPRANTMVVCRADMFGLAQLHQLRGRVGRGRMQGICYLTTPAGQPLAESTAKRLGTLQAFDRLGAGLALSARDLDLRGAGDLMGEEQAGHLKLIGLSLYQELLGQALKVARGEPAADAVADIQIDLPRTIPAAYVPEPEVRLNLYHRLARAAEAADAERLADEITDRFGQPPPPVQALLALAGARALARIIRATRIAAGPQAVAISFAEDAPGARDAEAAFPATFRHFGKDMQWNGERLLLRRATEAPEERLDLLLHLLEHLAGEV
jgi:transcription-repair coupling factor (superfamily II helicase)